MFFVLNYLINNRLSFKVNNKKTILYTALASLAFTTDLTLWHFSMTITSVSNATIKMGELWNIEKAISSLPVNCFAKDIKYCHIFHRNNIVPDTAIPIYVI